MFSNTVMLMMADDKALVHDSFVVRGQAVQSAWVEMETTDALIYAHPWEGRVRIVTQRQTSDPDYTLLKYLHRPQPPPSGMLYVPRMDRLELIPSGSISYNVGSDETTIPHTDRDGDMDRTFCVTKTETNVHQFIKPKRLAANGDPVFAGDIARAANGQIVDQYLGFVWDSELVLSELYAEKVADDIGTEEIAVFHFETTDYLMRWQAFPGKSFSELPFQSVRVGLSKIGVASFETKFKAVHVVGDPRTMLVEISSGTPGQFAIMALEYVLQAQGRGGG